MVSPATSLSPDFAMPIHGSLNSSTLSSPGSVIECIPVAALNPTDFHQRYRNPGIPIAIRGLITLSPEWDLNFLCQYLNDQVFPIRHYGRERYQQDKRTWSSSGSGVDAHCMTFADYTALIKSGEAYRQDLYLARCSLKETPLAVASNVKQAEDWLGLKFPATYLNLWVGPGGHTSSLHYDPMDGILMQLHGCKKVLLFPPSQTYNLYPIPVYKQLRHGLKLRAVYSQVYPENPDFEAFPKFQEAAKQVREVILEPGDVLFLPAGWWHEVISLGEDMVCSINRFWHVFPLSRAFRSWNKWRAHLASVCAGPQTLWNIASAYSSRDSKQELQKLIQRF